MKNKLFEDIYNQYAMDVKRFIFTISRRDSHFTDDIFQNTMESTLKSIGQLRDVNKAKSWMFSIAKNEARKYFNKNKYFTDSGTLDIDDLDSDIEYEINQNSFDFTENVTDKMLIESIFVYLNDSEAQVILLFYRYDLKLTEIGEILNMNYNSVKSLYRRSMKKIKVNLEKGLT